MKIKKTNVNIKKMMLKMKKRSEKLENFDKDDKKYFLVDRTAVIESH